MRADQVGTQVEDDGHGEHGNDELIKAEEAAGRHAQGPDHHDRCGQVQGYGYELDDRVCIRIEDVRPEEVEERPKRHPRVVRQVAEVRVRPDVRLPVSP